MSEQMKNASDVLSTALAYATAGITILPLHAPSAGDPGGCTCRRPHCSSIGKHPAIAKGVHSATHDVRLVARLFANSAHRNLGLATGAVNKLVVVDIDKKSGGMASLEVFAQHGTPLTSDVQVNTGGGGLHLYFRHPGVAIANSAGKIAPGIDLRGDNGYVVAPPSIHQNGNQYIWDREIDNWSSVLPPLPQWLYEIANRPRPVSGDNDVLVPGSRNAWLTSYAGRLRRGGAALEELALALEEQNRLRCRPPLTTAEVNQIAKSVSRYTPQPQTACDPDAYMRRSAKIARDRRRNQSPEAKSPIPMVEPWPDAIEGPVLLALLTKLLQQHLSLPKTDIVTLALWVVFTHAHDCFPTSPILAVLSPDKRCGKTTLLSCLRHLVARPLAMSNITPAAIYRAIDQWHPTLLIDEADTFLEANEELRGILNSGHKREMAVVIRSSGENHEPRCFSTWSPKVIAKIGGLSATLNDRSVALTLRRKRHEEAVVRLDETAKKALKDAARMAVRWSSDQTYELRHCRPKPLLILNDRSQENWEPLLAIAQIAGQVWPALARQSAEQANALASRREDDSIGSLMLTDISALFRATGRSRLSSSDIASSLAAMEHRPWPEFRCYRPITPRQIAQVLRPFDITPKTIRVGDNEILKGYLLIDFEDAFDRYIDTPSVTP